MEKSANKLWRESGTTLSFKEWINRENQKKEEYKEQNFMPFIGEDIVKDTLDYTMTGGSSKNDNVPTKTTTVLGLNRGVLIASGIIIAGSLGYYFWNRLKKRQ